MSPVRERQSSVAPDRAIFGTVVVAWMLAGTKWGSYFSFGSIYIADVLLAIAVLAFVFRSFYRETSMRGESPRVASRVFTPLRVILGAFVAWVMLRMLAGGDFSIVALRDFAPYLYAVVALFAAASWSRSDARAKSRTMTWIWFALIFHLIWVLVATWFPALLSGATFLDVALFRRRLDIDGAVIAITAGLAIYRWARRRQARYGILLVASLAAVSGVPSRAGLLAAAVAVVVALAAVMKDRTNRAATLLIAGAGPLLLIVVLASAAQTTAGERTLSSFGIAGVSSSNQHASASGTTQAREEAWQAVGNYVARDDQRLLIGVGFGPDFMAESSASYALLGSEADERGVRSPHNYWVGTFARLGLVGVVLFGSLVLGLAARLVSNWQVVVRDELLLTTTLIVVCIAVAATFGVILESPFGAIPFFWAVGVLIAGTHNPRRLSRRDTRVSARAASSNGEFE